MLRLVALLLAVLVGMALAAGTAAAGHPIEQAPAQGGDYGGLNEEELKWCANPTRVRVCNSAYRDLANWAEGHATNCEDDKATCTNGDEANAYQHCLWSAALKLYHGEGTARGFLERHEANSDGDNDSVRDWSNNDKGFQVAGEAAVDMYINNRLTRKGAILNRCIDLARSEQLTYCPNTSVHCP